MKCKFCGREFEPLNAIQKYCSPNCRSNFSRKFKRLEIAEKIQRYQKKESRFNKWIDEAQQCGMSYGIYRMNIEKLGKTFEELRL